MSRIALSVTFETPTIDSCFSVAPSLAPILVNKSKTETKKKKETKRERETRETRERDVSYAVTALFVMCEDLSMFKYVSATANWMRLIKISSFKQLHLDSVKLCWLS